MSEIRKLQELVEKQKETNRMLCEATQKMYETIETFSKNIAKADEKLGGIRHES